jgi:hypothetical protein
MDYSAVSNRTRLDHWSDMVCFDEGSSIRFPLSVLCVKESTGSPSKSRRLSLGLQIGLIYLLYVEESPTHLMRESS